MSTPHQFHVMDIPGGSPGKRLDVAGIDYPDLDVYTCSDQYSNDVASVNITACELAYAKNTNTYDTLTHKVFRKRIV